MRNLAPRERARHLSSMPRRSQSSGVRFLLCWPFHRPWSSYQPAEPAIVRPPTLNRMGIKTSSIYTWRTAGRNSFFAPDHMAVVVRNAVPKVSQHVERRLSIPFFSDEPGSVPKHRNKSSAPSRNLGFHQFDPIVVTKDLEAIRGESPAIDWVPVIFKGEWRDDEDVAAGLQIRVVAHWNSCHGRLTCSNVLELTTTSKLPTGVVGFAGITMSTLFPGAISTPVTTALLNTVLALFLLPCRSIDPMSRTVTFPLA